MKNLFYLATILLVLGITLSSCEKEPEPESEFYIRGNFNGEYLNYSMDTAYYYINEHRLDLLAYNNPQKGPHNFSLNFLTSPKRATFNIDSISLPYTIKNELNDITGAFTFIKDTSGLWNRTDTTNYFAIIGFTANYIHDFTIIIDKKENDIVEGRFYGELQTSFEPIKKMTVTSGEFRAKFDRVTFSPWWYYTNMATKTKIDRGLNRSF
jgi:hypothetical protein